MNPQSFIRPVVLTTVELGTVFAVGTVLNKALMTVAPDLGLWNGEWTRKEKAIQAAKLIGVSVGIALIAGAAANVARTATEQVIWNDIEVTNPEI